MLLTGAIHEDGLSDYMDGLGGRSRTQVLVIMKDSHAGTYGILALAVYLLTLFASLLALGETLAPIAVLVGDPLSKWISSWIALRLPYARKDGESKMGLAYQRPHRSAIIASATLGLIPLALLAGEPRNLLAALPPIAVFGGMVRAMRRRIGGYTGDCCGALFALCELSFYLGLLAVARVWSYI